MRVVILVSNDGYEAMYINDELIEVGNPLGEGNSAMYLISKSEEYDFTSEDIEFIHMSIEDSRDVEYNGQFHQDLKQYNTVY